MWAVDVSTMALDRAATDAATAGVADRIDFQRHDLALTFPSGAFDLVSAQYLHSPIEFPRVRVLQKAASAVTPGGLLLIVDHASVSPGSWADPEQTLGPLELSPDEWHTERLEAREREATGPNGRRASPTTSSPLDASRSNQPTEGRLVSPTGRRFLCHPILTLGPRDLWRGTLRTCCLNTSSSCNNHLRPEM